VIKRLKVSRALISPKCNVEFVLSSSHLGFSFFFNMAGLKNAIPFFLGEQKHNPTGNVLAVDGQVQVPPQGAAG